MQNARRFLGLSSRKWADLEEGDPLTTVLLSEKDSIPQPTDLDDWLSQLYEYFVQHGFACIIAEKVVNLSSVIFTLFLSGFLLLFVDWSMLWSCSPHCAQATIITTGLHSESPMYITVVAMFLVVLSGYCVHCVFFFGIDVRKALLMKQFVNSELKISERELLTVEWDHVIQRLMDFQKRNGGKFFREFHDEHDVVSRIMRKTNILIALLDHTTKDNDKLLVPRLPLPLFSRGQTLTRTQEWVVNHIILDRLFGPEYIVHPETLQDVAGFQAWLRGVALLNLVLSPFIVFFVIIYTFFSNAEEIHRNPSSLGSRRWSTYAEWMFREYNELPHLFNRRLARSLPSANKYVEMFRSPFASIVARFLSFVLGSCLAVLVLLGLVNESFMDIRFADRNLWWYLGVFGTALACTRAFIIHDAPVNDPGRAMRATVEETHYMPRRWHGKCHTLEVFQEFVELFPYRIAVFVQEILGVLLTPLILYFHVIPRVDAILTFLSQTLVAKENIGFVCSFADFRFDRHGNSNFGAEVRVERDMRSRGGKLERSFVGFVAHHPEWRPKREGEQFRHFLTRLEQEDLQMGGGGGALADSFSSPPLSERFHPPFFPRPAMAANGGGGDGISPGVARGPSGGGGLASVAGSFSSHLRQSFVGNNNNFSTIISNNGNNSLAETGGLAEERNRYYLALLERYREERRMHQEDQRE